MSTQQQKEQNPIQNYDFYTDKEIELLDKYKYYCNSKFEDNEIYDLMVRFKNDDIKIKEELDYMMRDLNRGDEFQWHLPKTKNKKRKEKIDTKLTNEEKDNRRISKDCEH